MALPAAASAESQRVLVCEDERHVSRLLQVNLERQGYTVVCACDGRQAIQAMEKAESRVDRVILDATLPEIDAYEVLTWIRTHEKTRDTWVAFMFSEGATRDIWESKPHQPDVYASKQFSPYDIFR